MLNRLECKNANFLDAKLNGLTSLAFIRVIILQPSINLPFTQSRVKFSADDCNNATYKYADKCAAFVITCGDKI